MSDNVLKMDSVLYVLYVVFYITRRLKMTPGLFLSISLILISSSHVFFQVPFRK